MPCDNDVDWSTLDLHLEWALVLKMARFADMVRTAVKTNDDGDVPAIVGAEYHHVADFIARLAHLFSKYVPQEDDSSFCSPFSHLFSK